MKRLLPAILAIFLLAGCSATSVEPINETASEKNQTADSFERNLECQKLQTQIENYLADSKTSLESIFYSPKINSCLYVSKISLLQGDNVLTSWGLVDAFTKQNIEFITLENNRSKIDTLIQEYQN